jgi:tetratricopeptide (TPR) repeat protein
MILSPSGRTVVLSLVLLAGFVEPSDAVAQDPCPAASGADAEVGWAAYQGGDIEGARARFERALSTCENDQYARTGLGYVALRNGDTAGARRLMAQVVQAEPNNVDALVGLGLAAWRTGELGEVREYFERVQLLVPDDPTAATYLARLDGAREVTSPTDAADVAWAEGDVDRAFDLYSARLDRDPTDGLALLRVGQLRSWREEYPSALEVLSLLIDLEPGNFDARLARARVYAWSGDLTRAESEVGEVLSVMPDNVEALAARALFQAWAGKTDQALASYDNLLSIAPEHQSGRRQRAQAGSWAGRADESIVSYRALLAEEPDDLEARVGLATTLGYAGRYDESLAEFDEVLARAPRDLRALTGKARTHTWAGDLIDGERAALQAVEVDSVSGSAWASVGEVYRAQNRDAAALEALRKASAFEALNADIRDQYRSVELSLSPDFRPTVIGEDDSDGNRMVTTSLDAEWNPTPRLVLRGRGYYKQLEQDGGTFFLEQRAYGGRLTAEYQARPGWRFRGGVGGSATDGTGRPTFLALDAGIRTPDRGPFGISIDASVEGLDETAALARRGVRASTAVLSARWFPGARWRVDGSLSVGEYQGDESNARRGWFAGVTRRMGSGFSLGVAHRGFSFEKNLDEGYFDPDFYGIVELTSYWLYRPAPWSVLVEVAPGLQQVTADGDPSASLRSNLRLGYSVDQARELSLSLGYSSAGLTSFASGADDYRYLAFILGVTWIL